MEEVTSTIKTIQSIQHSFYCDNCKKFLGESIEHEDGYYKEFGKFELALNVGKWLKIEKHFCQRCRSDFMSKIRMTLEEFGFESDR